MGEAYAYFKCNATKTEIEAELPTARFQGGTPSDLEINLDTPDKFANSITDDPELSDIMREAVGYRDYVMAMRSDGLAGEKIAAEAAEILHRLYSSPLYQKGEKCFMEVFYKGPDGTYAEFEPSGK